MLPIFSSYSGYQFARFEVAFRRLVGLIEFKDAVGLTDQVISLDVDSLEDEILSEWSNKIFVHDLDHEVFELCELDLTGVVLVELVEEVVDVALCWLLLDTLLPEVIR